jgi:hypothetical protein
MKLPLKETLAPLKSAGEAIPVDVMALTSIAGRGNGFPRKGGSSGQALASVVAGTLPLLAALNRGVSQRTNATVFGESDHAVFQRFFL